MKTVATKMMYEDLYAKCEHLPNGDFFAKVISSWYNQYGILPEFVGMSEKSYLELNHVYFTGIQLLLQAPSGLMADKSRIDERQNLIDLLLVHRAGEDIAEEWVAEIIASACLGNDHLWQDTGLWSRKDLSNILKDNFTSLFEKNNKDMKWKKFLYKQLCAQEGIYVCRSPSCEVCADYNMCFGLE